MSDERIYKTQSRADARCFTYVSPEMTRSSISPLPLLGMTILNPSTRKLDSGLESYIDECIIMDVIYTDGEFICLVRSKTTNIIKTVRANGATLKIEDEHNASR